MKIITTLFITLMIGISIKTSAQVTLEDSFMVDGIMRNYLLYIPAINSPENPVPLVLNFHGYGSNKFEQYLYADFRPIADSANFIIALPNGSIDLNNTLSWNTFGIGTVDDVHFVSQLIDRINTSYAIDQNRIYSTGMSNGGFMSYELACQLSDKIAAIASVTGSMLTSKFAQCNPVHPVPVMQIHGTMDGTVPYLGNFAFAPIDSLIAFWVLKNQCNPIAEFEDVPNVVVADNCTAEHYTWRSDLNLSSVEFYKIIGGDHSWPGAIINLNTTNMDFTASAEIWRFFSQYSKDELITNLTNLNSTNEDVVIFPNPSSGSINIQWKNKVNYQYVIFNCLGQQVQVGKIDSDFLNYTPKEAGIYTIILTNSDKSISKRFIIN